MTTQRMNRISRPRGYCIIALDEADVVDSGELVRCPVCGFYDSELSMLDGLCWSCRQEIYRTEK